MKVNSCQEVYVIINKGIKELDNPVALILLGKRIRKKRT
jgi:hypothetical protein